MCNGSILGYDVMINAYSVLKIQDMHMNERRDNLRLTVVDSDMSLSPNIPFVEGSLNVAREIPPHKHCQQLTLNVKLVCGDVLSHTG